MANSSLIAYRSEILSFLMSCTIKNTWIADTYNEVLEAKGLSVDYTDPTTWKYYLNLIGEYHPSDEMMYVLSRDTQTEIEFTKEALALNPRTAAAYRPGTTAYANLCKKYPAYTDLIKNIMFPVPDIEAAIEADDLDLLHWGVGFLEADELIPVIQDIQQFLKYVANRWYMDWLSYEPYYKPLFWGQLWQHLMVLINVTRIKNIHTAHAHSFHIWEHLTSLGIGDYRDALTRRQSLFLYRNMHYILKNRGKHDNLILLVNQLLTEQNVAMVNKVIRQQTIDGEDECRWIPEFIAEPVQTLYANSVRQQPAESVTDITLKLGNLGLEQKTSLEDIDRTTRVLGGTQSNRLPTKLLEIQPTLQDRKYAELLNNYVLDTTVYMIQNDRYQTQVVVLDEQTGVTLRLTTKDALALFYYAIWKARDEEPVDLPSIYTPLIGSFRPDLNVNSLPKKVTYRGYEYSVSSFVDPAGFIAGARPIGTYITADEFSQDVGVTFGALIRQISTLRATADAPAIEVFHQLMRYSTIKAPYALTLSTHTAYADWLADPALSGVASIVGAYDGLSAKTSLYASLASRLIEALVPKDSESIRAYVDVLDDSSFYGRLKELFVQLCSYNVLFLDVARDRQRWELLPRLTLEVIGQGYSETYYESIDTGYVVGKHRHHFEGIYPLAADDNIVPSDRVKDTWSGALADIVLENIHVIDRQTAETKYEFGAYVTDTVIRETISVNHTINSEQITPDP